MGELLSHRGCGKSIYTPILFSCQSTNTSSNQARPKVRSRVPDPQATLHAVCLVFESFDFCFTSCHLTSQRHSSLYDLTQTVVAINSTFTANQFPQTPKPYHIFNSLTSKLKYIETGDQRVKAHDTSTSTALAVPWIPLGVEIVWQLLVGKTCWGIWICAAQPLWLSLK